MVNSVPHHIHAYTDSQNVILLESTIFAEDASEHGLIELTKHALPKRGPEIQYLVSLKEERTQKIWTCMEEEHNDRGQSHNNRPRNFLGHQILEKDEDDIFSRGCKREQHPTDTLHSDG